MRNTIVSSVIYQSSPPPARGPGGGERAPRRRAPATVAPATVRPEQDRPVDAKAPQGLSRGQQGRGPCRVGVVACPPPRRGRRSGARALKAWVWAWRSRAGRTPRVAAAMGRPGGRGRRCLREIEDTKGGHPERRCWRRSCCCWVAPDPHETLKWLRRIVSGQK